MINTFYILFFQIFVILFILLLLWYEMRVVHWGSFIIFSQFFTLFLVIFNRSLGLGFNISVFLYIVIIPVIFPYIAKKIAKRYSNSNSNSTFKKLFLRLRIHLEASFFNFFFLNKGLLYLSEKYFAFFEEYFRKNVKNPRKLISFFILYPWIFFIIILVFEMFLYEKVYFSAVLLSINVLLYRLLLLFLRIIQYTCINNLNFILVNANFEISHKEEKCFVFFFKAPILEYIIDNNTSADLEYLSKKWLMLISGINFSTSYFFAYILKNYLIFYYRNLLNMSTIVFVIFGYISKNYYTWPYFMTFIPVLVFLLFYFFCFYFFRTKYVMVDNLLSYQKIMTDVIENHLSLLIERNFLRKNFRQLFLFSPTLFLTKPKTFAEFFSPLVIFDEVPEKLSFYQVLRSFFEKIYQKIKIFFRNYWYIVALMMAFFFLS